MSLQKYTCVCFFHRDSMKHPLVYHNIVNFKTFEAFLQKNWPGILYYNRYKKGQPMVNGERIWIHQIKQYNEKK